MASLAPALETLTKLSQSAAAWAILVPRWVFAVVACSAASAAYAFANVRQLLLESPVFGG